MLKMLKRLIRFCFGSSHRHPKFTGLTYWEERARKYGARAVLNLEHAENEFEEVTHCQTQTILPFLIRTLTGDERIALDFGCGPGRFTARLAEAIRGRAIGVDPIRKLIEIAPSHPSVEYLVSDGLRIPLANCSVDVAWVCLVLGGLSEEQLAKTAVELKRVLRPNGLLFVVENTTTDRSCHYWIYRSVCRYQSALSFAPLTHLHDYEDLGERISIMAGRKQQQPDETPA